MPKFVKRPICVEAQQLEQRVVIHTLEGDLYGEVGDWLITGVKGEQYPCKPDIFALTYQPYVEGEEGA